MTVAEGSCRGCCYFTEIFEHTAAHLGKLNTFQPEHISPDFKLLFDSIFDNYPTHHPELLKLLVAFDEERALSVSCPVTIALASPACRKAKTIPSLPEKRVPNTRFNSPIYISTKQTYRYKFIKYICVI